MTKDEIIYSTTEQQIEKLKSQHLTIEDESYAKKQIQTYGYFNIIKGYRDPYIINTEHGIKYRNGVTFEQIVSLFILDKNLRNAVIATMLDLEEYIKAVAADIVAESFGVHQDNYLKFDNYRDRRRRKYRFSLSGILETIETTLQTGKDPVFHYRKCHGIVPPWVLFKTLYFSTIVNLISLFKPSEQEKMVLRLYDIDRYNIPIKNLRNIMMDTLFICLEYRNLAAHGGRVYNYSCNSQLRFDNFPSDNEFSSNNIYGFSQLLLLLDMLKYRTPSRALNNTIHSQLNRHCNLFPEDTTYLAQTLNVNITPRKIVWISQNSNKFHFTKHCSGMKDPIEIGYDQALENGYVPCKRCSK